MIAVTSSTPVELFASLRKAGIRLWREGDQLRYRAAAGTLTPELRQLLLEQKSGILEFLKCAEEREREPPLRSGPTRQGPAIVFCAGTVVVSGPIRAEQRRLQRSHGAAISWCARRVRAAERA